MRNLFFTVLGSVALLNPSPVTAQGTVLFANRVTGSVFTHVYAPLSSDPTFHQIGNGPGDTPVGTEDWTSFTLIGATGSSGPYSGDTTFAQLLAAPGFHQPDSSMVLAAPTTTFRTGATAGQVVPIVATLNNVDYRLPATVEMVAWDNSSRLYPSWTEASTAWASGLIAAGRSNPFNVQLGSELSPPAELFGLQSFNLYIVPEPSCIAVCLLSVVGLRLRLAAPRFKERDRGQK
jgi:hypothetical protein